MPASQPLAGRTALVTGGSRGIGAAIARRLARDGAAVALTYAASPDRATAVVSDIAATGGRALAIAADSADPAALRQAIASTVETYGGLDILVSNAGILMHGAVDDFPLADFDRMVAVNLRPLFVAAQAAAPHLGSGGRIIAIGSVAADTVNFPGASVYAMTKAAVAGLVRGMAQDFGPRGITVNTVQPGPTVTDMNPAGNPYEERLQSMTAVKRLGRDDEIAAMVAFLAGPDAGYVTGASLTVDGGYTI